MVLDLLDILYLPSGKTLRCKFNFSVLAVALVRFYLYYDYTYTLQRLWRQHLFPSKDLVNAHSIGASNHLFNDVPYSVPKPHC